MIKDAFLSVTQDITFPEKKSTLTGSAFIKQIYSVDYNTRNSKTVEQFTLGNFPDFYKSFSTVKVYDDTNTLIYFVAKNYICIGDDNDYVIMPVTAEVAQSLCDITGCILPTRKMVNDIYQQCEVKIPPSNIPPDNQMTSTPRFKEHSDKLIKQIGSRKNQFIAGHKKDYVLTNKLAPNNPLKKIAIYGWFLNGEPIQGLNAKDHGLFYIDYSQSARLISKQCVLNGNTINIVDVLSDANYYHLLSDEGPLNFFKY